MIVVLMGVMIVVLMGVMTVVMMVVVVVMMVVVVLVWVIMVSLMSVYMMLVRVVMRCRCGLRDGQGTGWNTADHTSERGRKGLLSVP